MSANKLTSFLRVSARTAGEARRQYWSMVLVASGCLFVAVVFAQQAQWYYGDYQAALQFCTGSAAQLSTVVAHCSERTIPSEYFAAYSQSLKSGVPYLLIGLFLGLLAFLQLSIRVLLEMQKMRLAGDAVGPSA